MSTLFYIGNTLLTLCIYLIILRIWMQFVRVNYYNPCTQFIVKLTQPVLGPLRKMVPSIGKIDTASFVVLYLLALIKFIFIVTLVRDDEYFNVTYLFSALLVILNSFGHLIFWILLARAILSWISRGQSLLEEVLAQLSEPLIAPIRRIIPPIGSIDISFMIFVFVLVILNMVCMGVFDSWGLISL